MVSASKLSALSIVFLLVLGFTEAQKIKPQLAATGVSTDGHISVILTNGVGTKIKILGVAAKVVGASSQCVGVPEYPTGYINAGENFKVEFTGCTEGMSPMEGDVYSASIRIDYEVEIGSSKTQHTDGATIRGPFEGLSGKPVVLASQNAQVTYPTEIETAADEMISLKSEIVVPAVCAVFAFIVLLMKIRGVSLARMKKPALLVAAVILMAFILMSLYMANLESFTSQQQTLFFTQDEFVEGSNVALRLIVKDGRTGEPLPNTNVVVKAAAPVSTQKSEKTLYTGVTDAFGATNVKLNLSELGDAGDYRIVFEVGDDKITQNIKVVRRAKVLLTSDKPIYQPNQVIHIRALVLKPFDLRPYANNNITFEVEDSKSNKIYKKQVVSNEYGIAYVAVPLADDINLGRYTMRAKVGDLAAEKTVEVKKYSLPKFKTELTTDKKYYKPGDEARVALTSNYIFGKPVSNAKLTLGLYTYDVEFKKIQETIGKTDYNGNYDTTISLPDYFVGLPIEKGNSFVAFNLTLVDTAGHSESIMRMVPVTQDDLVVQAIPESEKLSMGAENRIYVVTTYPDGTPAQATVEINGKKTSTNRLGIGEVAIKPESPGIYKLEIRADDGKNKVVRAVREITSVGGEEQMLLRTDKPLYNVGDQALFECITNQEYGTKSMYLDIIKDKQTILTKAQDTKQGRAVFTVGVSPDMMGLIEVHCYKTLRSVNVVRDTKKIIVDDPKTLTVKVTPDKPTYLPGENARISFRVEGFEGPVQSALGVKIVDESVYALEELSPGFERVYFLIEKELMTPSYQVKIFSPYELVDRVSRKQQLNLTVIEPVPLEDARQAVNVLIAAANLTSSDYEIKKDTYEAKMELVRKRKAAYWDGVWAWISAFILYGFITAYVSCFIAGVYWAVRDRNKLILAALALSLLTFAMSYVDLGHLDRNFACVIVPFIACVFLMTLLSVPLLGLVRILGMRKKANDNKKWLILLGLGWVLAAFIILFVVVWQLGIFNMGSASITSTGGWDRSLQKSMASSEASSDLLTQSARTSREAASGKPYLRQYFPETLFFSPSIITDENGRADVSLQMADSITNWRLDAIATTKDGRLGTATENIRVFQDFFIDLNIPRTITQGDEIWVPATVYNYLGKWQNVRIELLESDWFELQDAKNKTLTVAPQAVSVEYFRIKALKHGKHRLTLYGFGEGKDDAITRIVEVVPNGEERIDSTSGSLDGIVKKQIHIPENSIDGTEKITVKIYPGYFSQIVEGLDSLLRKPYGCFEQTTSITYPNILVLDYMKKTGQIRPELQMQAENYIALGYQRLMNFETPTPGGFDWGGNPPPKLLLTAYGLMEFKDMSEVYDVDPTLIPRTQKWLASQQSQDGSWDQRDYLGFSSNIANSRLSSTCFVTWSLAHSEYAGEEVDKGINYIRQNTKPGELDAFNLALCANALLEKNPQDYTAKQILEQLDKTAINDPKNNVTHWGSQSETPKERTWAGSYGSSRDLEATALAALAYMKAGYKPSTTHGIIRYLSTKKDGMGNFGSTQATILTLKAFVYASQHLNEPQGASKVTVSINGEPAATLRFDTSNNDVVRYVDLKSETVKGANDVELSVDGDANLFYQLLGEYYLPWAENQTGQRKIEINVAYSTQTLRVNDMAWVDVEVRNNMGSPMSMILMDVGIPPGFEVVSEDLDQEKANGKIFRYDVLTRQVILYSRDLSATEPLKIKYRIRAVYPIKAKTPASQVYEYYNPEVRDVDNPKDVEVEK